MLKSIKIFAGLVLAALLTIPSGGVGSAAAKTDFPKKDINFIVPVNPGGGLDRYGRLAANYMEKHLPNRVNVIVKNMPGAEMAMAINTIMHARPDGYTVGVFSIPGNALNQVLGGRGGGYDLRKVTWLGNVTTVPQLLTVNSKSSYKRLEDLQKASAKKPLNCPIPGFTSVTGAANVIAAVGLGIKTNFIPQNSAKDTVLALLRGDGDYITSVPVSVAGQVKSGELRPLVIYGDKRLKEMPDVPTIVELGSPELANAYLVYYLVGATPNLPADVAGVLRTAFKAAVEDPEAQEAIRKTGVEPDYRDHKGAEKIIEDSIRLYEKYEKDLRVYIK